MVRILAVTTLFAAASVANAGISASNFSLEWIEIDNSVSPATGTSPSTDLQSPFDPSMARTYRLVLFGDASVQGERIDAVNFGGVGGSGITGIVVAPEAGTIYNHSSGGNVRSTALEGFLPAVYFDTYAMFGDTAPSGISFANTPNFTSSPITGIWFGVPGVGTIMGAEGVALIQITLVGGDGVSMGGNGSNMQVSGMNFPPITLDVPAVPTPGAVALLGLAGLATARRRR